MTDPTSEVSTRKPRCDHICLLDDGHLERGELHQYGYELPSPRADADRLRQAREIATRMHRYGVGDEYAEVRNLLDLLVDGDGDG